MAKMTVTESNFKNLLDLSHPPVRQSVAINIVNNVALKAGTIIGKGGRKLARTTVTADVTTAATDIPVADASLFAVGDSVWIGAATQAYVVTAVNIETNIITLDTAITCAAGDSVCAVDAGAPIGVLLIDVEANTSAPILVHGIVLKDGLENLDALDIALPDGLAGNYEYQEFSSRVWVKTQY